MSLVSLTPLAAARLTGSVLGGRYRLERRLGRGGLGLIYAGLDLERDTPVAVKVLDRIGRADEASLQRSLSEASEALSIDHPNAVDVLDQGVSRAGVIYLVMELLEGEPLAQRLGERGVLTLGEALALVADVAGVLRVAHDGGVIHGDVSSANIFLHRPWPGQDAEVVKLLDLGVPRLAAAIRGAPSPGSAADVLSLGEVLYQVLAGRLPFDADRGAGRSRSSPVRGAPPTLRQLDPGIPAAISSLARRSLSTRPDDRPSAAQLEHELRALVRRLSPAQIAYRSP